MMLDRRAVRGHSAFIAVLGGLRGAPRRGPLGLPRRGIRGDPEQDRPGRLPAS